MFANLTLWKMYLISFAFIWLLLREVWGFPDNSVSKKYTCNAGDPSLIPGSGRSPGEGISYPFQYSWASPVAQMVKILPAMRDTWVRSLGWEDALEEGMATHSNSCLENPQGQKSLAVQGAAKTQT